MKSKGSAKSVWATLNTKPKQAAQPHQTDDELIAELRRAALVDALAIRREARTPEEKHASLNATKVAFAIYGVDGVTQAEELPALEVRFVPHDADSDDVSEDVALQPGPEATGSSAH